MARKLVEIVESRLTVLLAFMLLAWLMLPPVYVYFTADKRPPIQEFQRAEALTPAVKAGQPVIVRIAREKVRGDCLVTSYRNAVSEDGVSYTLPTGTWVGGDPSRSFLDYAYPTIPGMLPGKYRLKVRLSYRCPNVKNPFEYDQPEALFEIVEGPFEP